MRKTIKEIEVNLAYRAEQIVENLKAMEKLTFCGEELRRIDEILYERD